MPRDIAENALIAIVEDDGLVRRAMERLLRAAGYRVVSYASGADFLHSLHDRRPACVVMDLGTPVVTGFDVLTLLRREAGRIPVVVTTADDSPQIRCDVIAVGASACLDKPVDDTVLLDAISAALQPNEIASDRTENARQASGG